MKIANIEINGKSYPAAFSLRVLGNLEERTGKPAGEALDALLGAESLDVREAVWLLAQMLTAGAAATTGDIRSVPNEDELLDSLALDDMHMLVASILASVHTARPRIEAETPVAQKKTGARAALRTLFG